MRKKKKIAGIVSGLLAMVCVSTGIGAVASRPSRAETVQADNYNVNYYYGDEISLTGKQVTYQGKQYDADVLLIAPNGNAYAGDSYVFSQAGAYTVEYRFKVNGKTVLTTETFTVLQNLFDLSTSRSSAEYTTYTDEIKDEDITLASKTSEGLLVNLASGDEFVYNKIINLSDNTKLDKLLGLFVIPQNKGTADLYKIDVTFTDVYDENNAVTVTFKTGEKGTNNLISEKHYYEYKAYMSAAASGQLTTGIDLNPNGTFIYDGNVYYKWVSHAQYGYMFQGSFYGSEATVRNLVDQSTLTILEQWLEYSPIGSREMEIYFDYASRQIHGSNTSQNPTTLVCDLDDSAFFNELWDGFTTGEVKMSIRGGNYVSSSASFMITTIDGDNLSARTLTDSNPPSLSVDTQGYAENSLPVAKKGLPYKLFPATARDDYDGNREVVTNVYYNYNSNNQINVEIVDGAFTPAYTGTYTIVYTASDKMGNQTQKKLYVKAEDGLSLRLEAGDVSSDATLGKEVQIPAYTLHGATGDTFCEVTAKHKTKEAEYAVLDGAFVPLYAGEYDLVYTYGDYVETKVETKSFMVKSTDEPTIIDTIVMPKYLLQNCIYELPTVTGYAFENGEPIEKATTISVTENGETRTLANPYFAPQTAGKITVTYTVTDGENSCSKDFSLNVLDVGYDSRLAMEKYFVGDVTLEADQKYVQMTAKADEQVYFALPVQVYEFTSKLQIDGEKSDFDELLVRLQDAKDENVSLAFRFVKTDKGTKFYVNNGTVAYDLGYDAFFHSAEQGLMLNYSNNTKRVTFDGTMHIVVNETENGEAFTGFSNHTAYLSYEFKGVEEDGEATFQVYQINGQSFSNAVVDKIKPQLFIENSDGGLKKIGDKIYISSAFAFDMFDPNVSVTFTVFDPNGNICTSDDGVLLAATADPSRDYYITAKKLGSYVVKYQVCDGKGNKLEDSYAIKVVDKEPPVLTVKVPVSSAKVDSKITLYEAFATDNVTEQVTIKVYVYYPDGHTQDVSGQNSFVASAKGTYKITYMALDELQNTSFKTFVITVS